MAHGREIALQGGEQVALGAALKYLAQKNSPGRQHLARELVGRLGESDDAAPRPQEMKAVVELQQLEGGARAIALALGLADIGIVELAGEPLRRRRAPPLRRLDPNSGLPRQAAAGDAVLRAAAALH